MGSKTKSRSARAQSSGRTTVCSDIKKVLLQATPGLDLDSIWCVEALAPTEKQWHQDCARCCKIKNFNVRAVIQVTGHDSPSRLPTHWQDLDLCSSTRVQSKSTRPREEFRKVGTRHFRYLCPVDFDSLSLHHRSAPRTIRAYLRVSLISAGLDADTPERGLIRQGRRPGSARLLI